jgi:hypothetical protein
MRIRARIVAHHEESCMNRRNGSWVVCAVGLALALIVATKPAFAQTSTTGTLSGTLVDQQGGVLPGASVVATHTDTGTKYEAVTQADGRFQISNVRVGAYTVIATLAGFRTQTQSVVVGVGEERIVDFKMLVESVAETITVTGGAPVIDTTRAGTGSNISTETIETLPTISRSITDVARTNPFFNPTTLGSNGDKALSVAGQHNRYNNIQIDGAVNNDLFGLADSGTPGGQTGTQPISYDAIAEIQLVVAPYDVRQGGFAGGGLNIVTKSGTNKINGTGYYFGQSQGLIGQIPAIATVATPNPADTAVGTFTSKQGGFSLGGPIAQNKAFFFGNFDLDRKNTPSGFSLDGSSGQPWNPGDLALAQQALGILQNTYSINPGGASQFSRPVNSDKVFIRTDFNLSAKNQLTARVNYVNGLQDVGTPTTSSYLLPDDFYSIQDKVWSSVAQLNTAVSNRIFNELRVTYQRERNVRGPDAGFGPAPLITVDFPDGNNIKVGTDNSSQANALNQDIVEVNDDVSWLKGKHSFTIGTHNEFFRFYNLFIQNIDGNYTFSSVANLQAGLAQAYSHNFSNDPNNPLLAAQFSVRQYGVYAGDQWRAASNFTLTYGIRFDEPNFPDTPHANPLAVSDFGYRTDIVPTPKMFSPRAGFNWDLSNGSDNRQQIRGGVGSFAGRTPYVWLSNQYGNTGVDFTALAVSLNNNNKVPFVADINAQPTTVTGGATGRQTINMVDPNYKSPQILRGNIAYDRMLFAGIVSTTEFVWSKTQDNVLYKDLNYVPTGTAPDGRLTYSKLDSNINDALLLTNTNQGDSETIALKLERPFKKGFYVSGSYLYNRTMAVSDAPAFVAATVFHDQYVTYDINNPPLATSMYQAGHRVNLQATIPIPLWKDLRSYASFFYNGQSGQPYSLVFNGDANGDGNSFNDIAFLPSNSSQAIITNGTYAQLDAYLSSESAAQGVRGSVPNRNIGVSPWSNDLDFRYAVNIAAGPRAKVEATFDIFNLLNLFNKNWGWVFFPNFNEVETIGYGGIDKATGKEILNISAITSPSFLGSSTRDDLRSRWNAQWGLRVRF